MEFRFGDDRFADSANRVRVALHIRQDPARRSGRAIRVNAVAATDSLNRGRCPSPDRVAGAAGGAIDPSSAPAIFRRDQPRIRPPQINITTCVIMLADQLAHPLTSRVAAGSRVDLPAAFPHSRHDTKPAGPRSAGTKFLQPVFGADRARIRVHMAPARSRRRPKFPVSPGRSVPRPTEVSVSSPRSAFFLAIGRNENWRRESA